jgi:hypothetical protein
VFGLLILLKTLSKHAQVLFAERAAHQRFNKRHWNTYELKMPYRDGTTHVIFEPMDFIARPVSLVPKPRVTLPRFHKGFAPNSTYRDR